MRATNRLLAELPSTLAALLRPQMGRVAGEILREIRRSVPEYALPLEGVFGRVFVNGVEQALLQFLDRVADPSDPGRDTRLELFRKLGRCEVNAGRGMDTLQTAYRVGARVAWRRMAEFGQRVRLPLPTMCVLAEALFAYIDELSSLSVEGYAAAQARAAGALELRRKRLLETILAGQPPSRAELADLAVSARWPLPERVVAVALGRDADPLLPTAPVLDEVLADLEGPEPCLLLPGSVPLAALRLELGGCRAAAGPEVPLAEARESLRLARQALALVRRGHLPDVSLTLCSEHLPTLLLRQDEFLTRQMADRVLAPLADLTPKQRRRLADTLVVWLGVRGGAPEVAARLKVHPQTVRHRMRQLEKLFGDRLSDPDRRFELELALRANVLSGQEARPESAGESGETDAPQR
ncbi:PucR C-terminal helix-turn-helix domain-containing protein [Streptoalloteichus tenebrarius]|uniref:PucR C-terminal helix-turn-helix domain-containing protein n=1 Tax=Streptoalloteichus tenebrarius (strain ATCC 17920 / DSM 40477 / JCM 4838 / CBS 697.72 / NBRC 16177 / NCIMB 11028 / NRRL B-12390 / A12253. 1 / ISP 5477) TaxID=1933 RepID=A0ABT1HLR5_STRSD|nr:PucR family transcriptional regulator [Streptoalloteichus tenebrarius]MCP2256461.1 PucR C-terminal helix-turn-helix domain-containing protein [Streptoalloteichus tenebrarius]BFF04812.1 helix-turn-helix domain-containing protein [Streptoalloteichus tenebrarius]